MERQVVFPCLDRRVRDDAIELLEVTGLPDDHLVHIIEAKHAYCLRPVQVVAQFGQRVQWIRVIGRLRITIPYGVPLYLCNGLLQCIDVTSRNQRGIFSHAGKNQHLCYVYRQALTRFGKVLVVRLQVVIAVRHGNPALADIHRVTVGLFQVGINIRVIGNSDSHPGKLGNRPGQRPHRVDSRHSVERILHGLDTQSIDRLRIHPGAEQITYLLRLCSRLGIAACRIIDDRAKRFVNFLANFVVHGVSGVDLGNLGAIQPPAVRELVEIILRSGRSIQRIKMHARHERYLRLLAAGSGHQRRCQHENNLAFHQSTPTLTS